MRRHQRQNIAEAKEDCLEAVLHLRVDMLGPEDPKLKCTFGNQVAWGHFRQKREVTGIKSRKFHIRSLVSDSICSTRVVIGFSVAVALTCATFLFLSYYPALYLCSWAPDLPKPSPPPERTYQERADFVETEVKMKRQYLPLTSEHNPLGGYDIFDCPLEPPPFYPIESPIMDVLRHWPLSDTELRNQRTIHQGLCVFDFARHGQERVRKQIHNYRQAEKPFIIKNDPEVLKTVERWNTNNYLDYRLQGKVYRGEFSRTLSMMYWTVSKFHKVPKDFIPPTNMRPTTFELWKERAQAMENPTIATQRKDENSYLRFDGCVSPTKRCDALHRMWGAMGKGIYMLTRLDDGDFLHDELPWFSPRYYKHGISNDYLVEPEKARGIQCRFGAKGLVAENHFDNERNFIAVLGGERRYILGHPSNCKDMSLYPMAHPLERHSEVDWNAPNLTLYPSFEGVHVNEVVLQAGDVLYLPTYWFHHIVSLNLNYQCNTRSGHSLEYDMDIFGCGFLYPWPDQG